MSSESLKNTTNAAGKSASAHVSMREQAIGLTIASKLRARPELLNGVRDQLNTLAKTGTDKVKAEMSACLALVDRLPLEKLFEAFEEPTAEGLRLARLAAFQSILSPQDKRIIVQTTSQ